MSDKIKKEDAAFKVTVSHVQKALKNLESYVRIVKKAVDQLDEDIEIPNEKDNTYALATAARLVKDCPPPEFK